MKVLFRLVYCSRNSILVQQDASHSEVANILASSRVNNARAGVTGALLYSNGCFAQVLEGGLDSVQQTFERIQRDQRHKDVVVLDARQVEERLFGAWDMALAESAEPMKARSILGRALTQENSDAGNTVVALLDALVRRERDWAGAA